MVELLETPHIETHSLYSEQELLQIGKKQQEKEEKRYMKTTKPSYSRNFFNNHNDRHCDECGRTIPSFENSWDSKGNRKYCLDCSFKDKESNLSYWKEQSRD